MTIFKSEIMVQLINLKFLNLPKKKMPNLRLVTLVDAKPFSFTI